MSELLSLDHTSITEMSYNDLGKAYLLILLEGKNMYVPYIQQNHRHNNSISTTDTRYNETNQADEFASI